MEENKIKFKDLSLNLKISVIGGHISFISFVIGFLIGFLGAWDE